MPGFKLRVLARTSLLQCLALSCSQSLRSIGFLACGLRVLLMTNQAMWHDRVMPAPGGHERHSSYMWPALEIQSGELLPSTRQAAAAAASCAASPQCSGHPQRFAELPARAKAWTAHHPLQDLAGAAAAAVRGQGGQATARLQVHVLPLSAPG